MSAWVLDMATWETSPWLSSARKHRACSDRWYAANKGKQASRHQERYWGDLEHQRDRARQWYRDNPKSVRNSLLKKQYGIDLAAYETMRADQHATRARR